MGFVINLGFQTIVKPILIATGTAFVGCLGAVSVLTVGATVRAKRAMKKGAAAAAASQNK